MPERAVEKIDFTVSFGNFSLKKLVFEDLFQTVSAKPELASIFASSANTLASGKRVIELRNVTRKENRSAQDDFFKFEINVTDHPEIIFKRINQDDRDDTIDSRRLNV